jgi:hypothetical protein
MNQNALQPEASSHIFLLVPILFEDKTRSLIE